MLLICTECKCEFNRYPSVIKRRAKLGLNGIFCSKACSGKFIGRTQSHGYSTLTCSHCSKAFQRRQYKIKERREKNPDGLSYCSRSCKATYENTHKTYGSNVSKLEKWLQAKLTQLYPNLNFIFNGKEAISSELDIYIPSMNLAFELNGIFHYEPIFGENNLQQRQANDSRKFQACYDAGISLCVIDTSSQKYFKESTSQQFLDIITQIIDISGRGGIAASS